MRLYDNARLTQRVSDVDIKVVRIPVLENSFKQFAAQFRHPFFRPDCPLAVHGKRAHQILFQIPAQKFSILARKRQHKRERSDAILLECRRVMVDDRDCRIATIGRGMVSKDELFHVKNTEYKQVYQKRV